MIEVIFNSLLYFILFAVHKKRTRTIDCGFILYGTYFFVSICCIIQYLAHPNDWRLTLLPFIYLFIACILFFRPFMGGQFDLRRLTVKSDIVLILFVFFYVACSLIDMFDDLPKVMIAMVTDMKENRSAFYEDGRGEISSFYVWAARNVVGYFRTFALSIFFYFLSNLKKIKIHYSVLVLLFLSIVVPASFEAIIIASRGLIIVLFVEILIVYVLFYKYLSDRINLALRYAGIVLIVLIIAYSTIVTIQRFTVHSEYDNGLDALVFYFGHSMLTFDYGIVDTIRNYTDGQYFMGKIVDIDSKAGTHFSSHFFTFVGALYFDFGPIVTLLLAIIIPPILNLSFKKKKLAMADLFLYVFAISFFVNGVFVVASGYYFTLVMALLLFLFLKVFA